MMKPWSAHSRTLKEYAKEYRRHASELVEQGQDSAALRRRAASLERRAEECRSFIAQE